MTEAPISTVLIAPLMDCCFFSEPDPFAVSSELKASLHEDNVSKADKANSAAEWLSERVLCNLVFIFIGGG